SQWQCQCNANAKSKAIQSQSEEPVCSNKKKTIMPNIHGVHSLRSDAAGADEDGSDGEGDDNRYVGGVDGRGGGSGLAVVPNRDGAGGGGDASEAIFNLAESAGRGEGGGSSGGGEVRRTITMYRSGFTVDDGPYRRLSDPSNAEFLTSLARGTIPRELSEEAREAGGDGEVMVGLVDRRGQEFDPDQREQGGGGRRGEGGGGFQSFAGEGQSLGGDACDATAASSSGGIVDPSVAVAPQPLDASRPSTSVAVRLLNGKRVVVKVNLNAPVSEIGHHIGTQAGTDPYIMTSGYPPARIEDLGTTVEEAGLKGAQVVLKKA
ncbi:hypothetical protein ACHAWF_002565, partial [Thalassiosira exigua]